MSQGELTIDDYELVNCIATGNVSQVWEVRGVTSGKSYAMKLLLPEALTDNEQKRTMRHEASVMSKLEHPNIVQFVESHIARKQAYIIMELFRSVNLKALLRSDLHATHLRIKRVMECVTQALAYMHESKWIHKDVKPDNILVTKGGEVRVIDFSLAPKVCWSSYIQISSMMTFFSVSKSSFRKAGRMMSARISIARSWYSGSTVA